MSAPAEARQRPRLDRTDDTDTLGIERSDAAATRTPSVIAKRATATLKDAGARYDAALRSDQGTLTAQDAAQPDATTATNGTGGASTQTDGGQTSGVPDAGANRDAGALMTRDSGMAQPTSSKDALLELLDERANMSGNDALLVRSLITQLDTPFPANAMSMRLLLTTAVTSLSCPDTDNPDCAVICDYAADNCRTCIADAQCRDQFVVVCPGALMRCWTGAR